MKWRNLFIGKLAATLLLIGLTGLAWTPSASAATPEEIEGAIVSGLAWLAGQQKADGSWYYSASANPFNDIAVTSLVVLKFVERAKELKLDPFDTNAASPTYYVYASNVIAGFDYIFNYASKDAAGLVKLYGYETYNTGAAMMAIAATNTPSRFITVAPLNGMTYQAALQGMMDWMAFTQQQSGCAEGGWDYIEAYNRDWADQSNTGYATLGIGFASAPSPQGFGLVIPPDVLTKLSVYVTSVQDPVDGDSYDGGSWYEPCIPYKWVNILKTGNLLYEMALVGDEVSDTRVQDAISYIQTNWNATGSQPEFPATSLGWKDAYQAMFALMKGLEAFGITKLTVGSSEIDWFDEVSDVIVANQNLDGSWNLINPNISEGEQSANLRAAWAMLTLERVVPEITKAVFVDIKPGSCPNPLNLGSKGVLPVSILGTDEFDVSQIDPVTLKLTREGYEEVGVSPLRWSFEDVATPFEGELCDCHTLTADGYVDLSLKFNTQELVSTLGLSEVSGQTIPLILTGNLKEENGGTPIKGQDCIRVQK